MLSQQGACRKGYNGVTFTETQKHLCTCIIKTTISCGKISLSILILRHIHKSENELKNYLHPQMTTSSKRLKSYFCITIQVTGLHSSIITWQYSYILTNLKRLEVLNTPWAKKIAANSQALLDQRDNGIKVAFIIFYPGLFLCQPVI